MIAGINVIIKVEKEISQRIWKSAVLKCTNFNLPFLDREKDILLHKLWLFNASRLACINRRFYDSYKFLFFTQIRVDIIIRFVGVQMLLSYYL